jgi:opacity protein-like surface antigen
LTGSTERGLIVLGSGVCHDFGGYAMRWIVACRFSSARARRPIPSATALKRESLTALPVAFLLAVSASAVAQSPAPPPGQAAGGISISPKNGQTLQQQASDRYACHSWAKNQTGFDPTRPGGGVAQNEEASRRSEYRRAISACLEGRGYTVQFAAPPAAVPPVYVAPPTSVYAVPPTPAAPAYAARPRVVTYSAPEPELKYHPFQTQIGGGYTVATGTATKNAVNGGSNVGLGFTLFPIPALPVGIRVDGSYSSFEAAGPLLNTNGTQYTSGHKNIYGGDADLQFDLAHRSTRQKLYLFGGVGWYRDQTRLRQESIVSGTVCGYFYCGLGYFPAVTAEQNTISPWLKSWNAGLGWEVAIGDHASFFLEARYQHFLSNNSSNSSNLQFVPITVGIRF